MELWLILCIIVTVGFILLVYGGVSDNDFILGGGITAIIIACIVYGLTENTPSAMDVYQGKTTLEYTYRDGVAIDSVVVFKDNVK